MTKLTRRIIFYVFLFLFLAAVPIAILWSLGFRFDFAKKKIVPSGTIYLKSSERNFQIFINDKFKYETSILSSSALVSSLAPKDYKITVKKEGFENWTKTLNVKPQMVEEVTLILLIPKNIKIEPTPSGKGILEKINEEEFKTTGKYFIDNNGIVWQTSKNKSERFALNAVPLSKEDIKNPKFIENQNSLFLLTNRGRLLEKTGEKQDFQEIHRDIKNIKLSPKNDKLLILADKEIWVLWLEDVFDQPQRKKGEKELITRVSEPISDAVFYSKTNEHIIFGASNKIKITELDARGQRNTYDLAAQKAERLFYDLAARKLYFTSSATAGHVLPL